MLWCVRTWGLGTVDGEEEPNRWPRVRFDASGESREVDQPR